MPQLLFATANKNKLLEVRTKLQGSSFELLDFSHIQFADDIPEPHPTLVENAIEKARFIYNKYAINCFADDSGLLVDALNNEPGVLSARYAGNDKNDTNNNAKVLANLTNSINRKAKFITVIALILDGNITTFEGQVCGEILHEAIGSNGFGYDPIFKPEGYNCSFAQLTIDQKNKLSHRSQAIDKMIQFLQKKNSDD